MKKYITILVILFLFSDCSDSWLDEKPPHLITAETLYTNLDGFEAGLNGLYALVRWERRGQNGNGSNFLKADVAVLGTDNMTPNARGGIGAITIQWDARNVSTDTYLEEIFLWLYKVVNAANTIINRAENTADVNWSGGSGTEEENKTRVLAEAKALRAWAYRHLTFCWGDIPLSLEEVLGSNIKTDWKRTPKAEVREQMKADWLFAEQHLPVEPSVPGKISKGAVQTYLSELYLTLGKPDSALIFADKCINTPQYKLITERYGVKASQEGVPFMDMFYDGNSNREEGNTEALWVWQFEFEVVGGGNSIMRRWYSNTYLNSSGLKVGKVTPFATSIFTLDRGGRGLGRSAPTKWAIELYEDQDDRGSNYAIRKYYVLKDGIQNGTGIADQLPVGYNYGDKIYLKWNTDLSATHNNSSAKDWPFVRKWDSTPASDLQSNVQYNDQVYLRLAETYLLKAEAQFKLGNNSGAAETLNIIRRRAHASEITAADVTMDFILDERSRELISEEHRRYTLLRTGTWLERVQAHNHYGGEFAAARDTLFALPQIVIDANLTEKMPQNPGF